MIEALPATYCYVCVLILLDMCPHTTIHVSSYYYVCVLILLYVCPIRRAAENAGEESEKIKESGEKIESVEDVTRDLVLLLRR